MSWVPLDTRATRFLPQNRQYTELEALFALQVDYREGNSACVAGYAAQWRWSRDRVRAWLAAMGLQIVGQKGRNPGQLSIKSATGQQSNSNQSSASHLMFHDFGRLGDTPRQQPEPVSKATAQQPATPNIDNTYTSHQLASGCSDVERTQRLLATKFDDSHIPPSQDALRLWASWPAQKEIRDTHPS